MYFCLLYPRMKKSLKTIEKNAGIRVQWEEGDPCYENAKQRLNKKRKNELLIKLQKLASERIFLLELKVKYAGKRFPI